MQRPASQNVLGIHYADGCQYATASLVPSRPGLSHWLLMDVVLTVQFASSLIAHVAGLYSATCSCLHSCLAAALRSVPVSMLTKSPCRLHRAPNTQPNVPCHDGVDHGFRDCRPLYLHLSLAHASALHKAPINPPSLPGAQSWLIPSARDPSPVYNECKRASYCASGCTVIVHMSVSDTPLFLLLVLSRLSSTRHCFLVGTTSTE